MDPDFTYTVVDVSTLVKPAFLSIDAFSGSLTVDTTGIVGPTTVLVTGMLPNG